MRAMGRPNGHICTLAPLWALSREDMEASEGTSWSPGPLTSRGAARRPGPEEASGRIQLLGP